MHISHQNVCLEVVSYCLPEIPITMQETFRQLQPMLDRLRLPVEGLLAASGVEERRFWEPGVKIADIATQAARKALEESNFDPSRLGAVISTSVCKDYIEPSMASLVHGQLGLNEDCINFDVGNACLAFLNAVSIAAGWIEQRLVDSVLIVDGEDSREVLESTIHYLLGPEITAEDFREHFATLTLGSGSVAAILTHESISQTGHRVSGLVSKAATQWSNLCLGNKDSMLVQARPLMKAGVDLARKTWNECASLFGWTAENVDHYICHQVGRRHHEYLFESLGLPPERSFLTYPYLGNVGPASVPITLALAKEAGTFTKGDRLSLMGIGSGLNCSMMEILW